MKVEEHLKKGFESVRGYVDNNRKILFLSAVFFVFTSILATKYPYLVDSSTHIMRAEYILENLQIPYAQADFFDARTFVYPPVFHLLMAGSKAVFGSFRLVSPFMGALSVFLTGKLVGLWYDEDTAFLSALALALFPFWIIWSSRAYLETTVTAGFLITFYFYFKFLDTDTRKYIYYSFITGGFLAAVKTYGPMASIIVGLHYLWINRHEAVSAVKNFFFPGLTGILVSLPWPLRNLMVAGSSLPKITGRRYAPESAQAAVSGLALFVPPLMEEVVNMFLMQFFGIVRSSLMEGLYLIHPFVYYAWFLLPVTVFSLLAYGAYQERDRSFFWIWILTLVIFYEVARLASGGEFSFKYRHFATFSPVLALFMVRSYQRLPVKRILKKLFYIGLAAGMILQMLVASVVFIEVASTSYQPVVDYFEEEVPEGDSIYGVGRNDEIEFKTEKDFRVVKNSTKPGFIHPDRNFSSELRKDADWVALVESKEEEGQMMENLRDRGVLELEKRLNATDQKIYGDVGKFWRIYRVVG